MKLPSVALVLFGQLWPVIATAAVPSTTETCVDLEPGSFMISLKSEDGQYVDEIDNCTTLATKYGALCGKRIGKDHCCQTCQDLGRGCYDSLVFKFNVGGYALSCSEFITMDPCFCEDRYNMPDGSKLIVKDKCCLSCKPVNITELDCGCKDRISPSSPFKHPLNGDEALFSCQEVVQEFPELCRKLSSNTCCRSCKNVPACQDTKIRTWLLPGFTEDEDRVRCTKLIAADPCYCTFFREDCCITCESVTAKDLKKCCTDDPKFRANMYIEGEGEGKDRVKRRKCSRCGCQEFLEEDPTGEMLHMVCEQNINNAQERCCQSCKNTGFKPK